jgi:hypothetical protein
MTKSTNDAKVKKNHRFQRHFKTNALTLQALNLTALGRV